MAFRVTQTILTTQTLNNITRNARRLNQLRERLSTGSRINRPSDDPTTFLRILPLKNNIADLVRFQDNSVLASDIVNTSSAAFEDAVSLMSQAKEIAITGANGTLNHEDRATLAAQVDGILQQMVSISNSKLGDRFLFSGTSTSTAPFVKTETKSGTLVTYVGNASPVTVDIAPGTSAEISSSGKKLFMNTSRSSTTFTGRTGAATGSGTDSGRGMAVLSVEHTGFTGLPANVSAGSTASTAVGSMTYNITTPPNMISVNGGPAVSFDATSTDLAITTGSGDTVYLDMSAYVGGPLSGTFTSDARMSYDGGQTYVTVDFLSSNQVVKNADTGSILNVDSTAIVRTGKEQVAFGGTFDAFNVLSALRDLLQNDLSLDEAQVPARITALIGELDSVSDNMLEGLRVLGARGANLDLTRNRMSRLELTMQDALSRDQDIDLSRVILQMSQADVAYQASLGAGARVITPTLLNFL